MSRGNQYSFSDNLLWVLFLKFCVIFPFLYLQGADGVRGLKGSKGEKVRQTEKHQLLFPCLLSNREKC